MGRLYFWQKARLHCAQEVEDSRDKRRWSRLERGWVAMVAASEEGEVLLDDGVDDEEEAGGLGGGAAGLLLPSCCGPSGIMVLFWKQVHLQKEGTAGRFDESFILWLREYGRGGVDGRMICERIWGRIDSHALATLTRMAKRMMTSGNRAILAYIHC
jgi:hypothetical protein